VGMLAELMQRMSYYQVWKDKEVEVNVPIFYSISKDENWLRNNFNLYKMHYCDKDMAKKVEGNIDALPRGILSLNSLSISSEKLTNEYARANVPIEIEQDEGYKLETYMSYVKILPVDLQFTLTIKSNTDIEVFKLFEMIYRNYYKVQEFYINFENMNIPVQMGLQEDFSRETRSEFSYPIEDEISMEINFEVESYIPSFDPTESRHSGHRMQDGIKPRIFVDPEVAETPYPLYKDRLYNDKPRDLGSSKLDENNLSSNKNNK
jgi:hypothetical protein